MKSLLSVIMVATFCNASPISHEIQLRSSPSDPDLVKPNLTSIFLETFPGSPGTLPSSTNWLFDLGTSYPGAAAHWGNGESETYTNSPSNIQITKNQTLAITPRLQQGKWTSARMETQRSDFAAAQGGQLYVEGRIKLGTAPASKQQGIWPAFWALGSSFRGNYNNWPAASELDFLETVNGGNVMYSTLHCGVTPGGPAILEGSMCGVGMKGTWRDEKRNWYLDGTKTFTVTGAKVGNENTWKSIAHDEHFLLLNVAVGGGWPGGSNSRTIDGPSVGMEVDYVSVWST